MNGPLRGATIGAGKMGLAHSTIINSLPNVKLIAVCEPTTLIQSTFKQFASHIATYSDHEKMLKDEQPDFVFITTPSFLHIPIAIDCVKHGSHFFIEKPLATNGAEAKPLLEKLNNKNLVTAFY